MLIKVLSFIASLLSNTRYKAVFIPCFVVALALTGLTAVAVMHESNPPTTSTSANQSENSDSEKPLAKSPQVSGNSASDIKNDAPATPNPDTSVSSDPTPTPNNQSHNTGSPTATTPEITLTASAISIKADTTSGVISATVSDLSTATWTITPDLHESGVDVIIEHPKDGTQSLQFRLHASSTAQAGTYQLTITAKDSTRNMTATKVITLTITP